VIKEKMDACLIDKMTALDLGSDAFYPNGKLNAKSLEIFILGKSDARYQLSQCLSVV
jgi:hypothetical protein